MARYWRRSARSADVPEKEVTSMNTLCRDTGSHDWTNTTSETWRKCQRTNCKATQRLHRGRWVDAVKLVPKREEPTHEPIQGMMFC